MTLRETIIENLTSWHYNGGEVPYDSTVAAREMVEYAALPEGVNIAQATLIIENERVKLSL